MDAPVVFLNQEEVKQSGGSNMKKTMDVVEDVFSLHQKGDYVMPDKTVLRWGEGTEATKGRINGMPGYIGGKFNASGIKWISSNPSNPFKFNIPRAAGMIILNNSATYLPEAIMDGTLISSMRTAANNGLAAKYLAKNDTKVIGLIGAGVLNRTILLALYEALPKLEKVKLFDLNSERSQKFIDEMLPYVPSVKMSISESAKDAVEGSDVFVTATVTTEPIVKQEWINPGSLYLHVGAHECEFKVVQLADKFIVDDWKKIKSRGEATSAIMHQEGDLQESDISANLGELVNGNKKARESDDETIVFHSVGLGIQDIAVAKIIYEEAKAKGLGQKIELWGNTKIFM
ncbi:ornithine cyclodeaminase family protein [Natribacillus halophilus]|uniref:Ornithine cyclodeaminase n=1 Tax=Natribacillus halophilus TaxID=549003 RepID=A0A1G8P4Y4_9BACI|nr:ornithine cyclodeaminase family protein [Natribacillus halophilus]SDI86880.1 ornithine cyclodeaminase [Natribacillus halophilus]